MKTMPPLSRIQPCAFTLIELLVVISIIAILMGLLFPALAAVREQMRKTQARNDLMAIVNAVKHYQAEYGKLPPITPANTDTPPGDILVGDPDSKATFDNSALMDTLRDLDRGLNARHVLNPRRIVFLEGRVARDATAPRAGFDENTASKKRGCFFDPWGKQYCVILDANYDNTLDIAAQYTDYADDNAPRLNVGAFALGKDGALGTKGNGIFRKGDTLSDDVITWQ